MRKLIVPVIAAVLFFNQPAGASQGGFQQQLDELKKEMREMSSTYEARIAELEARLAHSGVTGS